MRSIFAATVLGMLLPLAACGNEPEEAVEDAEETASPPVVQDVQYYIDEPEERQAVVDECDNNPGELAETPRCTNAYEADRRAMSQGIRDALGQN